MQAELIARAPRWALCGDAPHKAALDESRQPAEIALKQRFCQLNPRNRLGVIIVDLDHTDGSLWLDAPPPTYTTINPQSGHQQAGYVLAEPVARGGNARLGPQKYADDVRRALTRELRGDPAFTGLISRGPFHPAHITQIISGQLWTLRDLLNNLPPMTISRHEAKKAADIADMEGRNCAMFDALRRRAYSEGTHDLWSYAELINNGFENHPYGPLSYNEINGIIKSITKWLNYKYTPGYQGSPRARMHSRDRGGALPEAEQQARRLAGQAAGAATRREATSARLRAAEGELRTAGRLITAPALAELAGVERRAALRYLRNAAQTEEMG